MNCPNCDGKLSEEKYEGVEIDVCSSCKGSWLDEGEISQIIEIKEVKFSSDFTKEVLRSEFAGIPKVETDTIKKCPHCSGPMTAVNFAYSSGIVIDRCPEHGIWLDHTELEKIQANREVRLKEAPQLNEEWTQKLTQLKAHTGSIIDPEEGPSSFGAINRILNFIVEKF